MADENKKQQAPQTLKRDLGHFSYDNVPEELKKFFNVDDEKLNAIPEGMEQTFSFINVIVGVKEGYILRKVGQAFMVMPTGARMKEYRGMITLNETGAFLFKEAQKPEPSREKLIAAAMEEYKVPEMEAAENVDSFIQQCAECNLFDYLEISMTVYHADPNAAQEATEEHAE